jgi:hypothetical protein
MAADRVDQVISRCAVVDEIDRSEEDDLTRCNLVVAEDDEGADLTAVEVWMTR